MSVGTFPWSRGLTVEDAEEHYDAYGFKDWTHKETGAAMIKIQHPEYEMWSTGIHARSDVSCADCHMPYVRKGGVKISDHALRSPVSESPPGLWHLPQFAGGRVESKGFEPSRPRSSGLLRSSEAELRDAIDAIVVARQAGAEDKDLAEALELHHAASLRWDYISSENRKGFHSPHEAARLLASFSDFARQAELEDWNGRR